MDFSIAQESRIGGREVNQDRAAWLATDDALLMVVADGMGGHSQGEVAAQFAIDTVLERFRAEARTRLADPAKFLALALHQAHRNIVRYAADFHIPFHAAPRTTCIACVVQDGKAQWAHAGDSRLYMIHEPQGSTSVARTRDHSVVQRMVDDGSITAAEAAGHPMRHRVFSCLGGDSMPQVEVSPPTTLEDGDLIALCTDGAWSPLGERMVTELRRTPLADTVPHLLDAALKVAGPKADNLTMIAMRWGRPEAPDSPSFCDTYVGESPLTDAEIDKAIAQIRRRNPGQPTGAS